MINNLILYHGSQQIVQNPQYGVGKRYNDYGQGFYCTENIELAKEWACPIKNDGYSNKYQLALDGLNIMYLSRGNYNILHWLALLLNNRTFDIRSSIGKSAKDHIISNFLPDTTDVDVIIGYRADDSYFSFAEDFVNNTISLRDLNAAMQLGTLGEQVVLISEKAFQQIHFLDYEVSPYQTYYYLRSQRDSSARTKYQERKKEISLLKEDIFILDIIREDMKNDDSRLQCHLCN